MSCTDHWKEVYLNHYHRALSLGAVWYCDKCNVHIKETASGNGLRKIPWKRIYEHKYRDRKEERAWKSVAGTLKDLLNKP